MTSTNEIAKLIEANTALKQYYEGARVNIDQRINTAAENVGNTRRDFFVDQQNGNDGHEGDRSRPLKSLDQVFARAVWGGFTTITLLSDYLLDRIVFFPASNILIKSDDANFKKRLKFASMATNGAIDMGHLACASFLSCHLVFDNLVIDLPEVTDANITQRFAIAGYGFTSLLLFRSEIVLQPNCNSTLFQNLHAISLIVQGSTFPANMGGHWVRGVPAGTDPKTITRLAATNLTSL